MGLPLPVWLKENREVLFPSISCGLSGRSNWKWSFFSCPQTTAVLRMLHENGFLKLSGSPFKIQRLKYFSNCKALPWKPKLYFCLISLCFRADDIPTSLLGFNLLFLCIFTVLTVRFEPAIMAVQCTLKNNASLCNARWKKGSKPNNENARLSLHCFLVRVKVWNNYFLETYFFILLKKSHHLIVS